MVKLNCVQTGVFGSVYATDAFCGEDNSGATAGQRVTNCIPMCVFGSDCVTNAL